MIEQQASSRKRQGISQKIPFDLLFQKEDAFEIPPPQKKGLGGFEILAAWTLLLDAAFGRRPDSS